MMASSDSRELVVMRLSKLHQMLAARGQYKFNNLIGPDGLLDALIVLFDECNKESVSSRSRHAKAFVQKYEPLIVELQSLRVSLSDFDSKGVIGRGHFGEVHVVHERGTKNVYALKILRKDDMLSQQNIRRSKHITDVLTSLHWLCVPERIQFKIAVLTFKVLHGTAPRYLGLLVRVSHLPGRRSLRSASTDRLIVPSFKLSTICSRSFKVAAAQTWNGLPDDVTSSPTLPTFRNRLKTYLFHQSYPDIVS